MVETACVLLCLPQGETFVDPAPVETEERGLRLVDRWQDEVTGVVGWSTGGWDAVRVAGERPDLPRLALVATPVTDDALAAASAVSARTLLLFGSADPRTGSKAGRSWKKQLATARLEMVPGGGHDLLVPMWPRILSHLAPGRAR